MSTEQITIVNNQDEIIGTKERPAITKDDIYRVSALWVTDSHGHILLAQRSFTKKHSPGKWGPAVAGTVEAGETYDDNIIKEIEEELGLTGILPSQSKKQRVSDEYNYFCQWYTLVFDQPTKAFTLEEDAVEQVKWFTRSDLETDVREHPGRYLDGLSWCLENL